MIGIYKITSKDTGKCYIGQSIDIETRWKQHISKALYTLENTKFYNALRKYGYENFTFEIIEECDKEQDILDERERYWIAYYNSYNDGYNSTLGGQNIAWKYDPELIKKLWDDGCSTGEIAKIVGCSTKTVNSRLQGYHDFDDKTSHQRSFKIKTFTNKQLETFFHPIEVHQYSLLGEYIASYPSAKAAAKAMGDQNGSDNISKCFRGKSPRHTAYGYQWSKEKVDKMPMTHSAQGTLVHCITTDMYFPSTTEAAKWANLKSNSNIKDCCRGRAKSAGKHPITGEKLQWEYIR